MARDVMDLAVVTAVWGSYGRFLPDWVDSIAEQTVLPSQVVIVDCGVDDASPARRALKALRGAGVAASMTRPQRYEGMGASMNDAVGRARTEWVVRLDADDTLLPHCVEDVRSLADGADVVAIGAMRDGREVLFPDTSTDWILSARQGALSPAAFRRSFWARCPFHEVNDWIESTFWVGLAHQGARFVPTSRPGFVYRTHPGSHSATISPADKRAARAQHVAACSEWVLT